MNISTIDSKVFKDETLAHSVRVSNLCYHFGQFLGYDEKELRQLELGGLLHDIGKLYVPPRVLYKEQPLTDDEFVLVRGHVENSSNVLNLELLPPAVRDMICQHHEYINGLGYPNSLSNDEIHDFAKILSIIDVYDALTNSRSYRKEIKSIGEVLEILNNLKGKQLDAELTEKFEHYVTDLDDYCI